MGASIRPRPDDRKTLPRNDRGSPVRRLDPRNRPGGIVAPWWTNRPREAD